MILQIPFNVTIFVYKKISAFSPSSKIDQIKYAQVRTAPVKARGCFCLCVRSWSSVRTYIGGSALTFTNGKTNLMTTESIKWYDRKWLVILLCIFFFPVGLYGLWKASNISKTWKIIGTCIITLLVISGLSNNDTARISDVEQKVAEKSDPEKAVIISKLKDKAKRDWPNDYTTQEYWVNEQIDAYEYMKSIADNEIKQKAQRDWPLDFVTQKFWYNEQIDARERMQ